MRKLLFHLLNLGCLFILVFTLTNFIMNRDNTLEEHGLWDSEKLRLELPVGGSEEFFSKREALKGGNLRMGEWGGFQRLTWRVSHLELPLSFDLMLLSGGDFSFFFSRKEQSSFGIRISRNDAIDSGFFEVDGSGRFLRFEKLKTKWHFRNNTIRFHFDGDHLVLGKTLVSLPNDFKEFGFNYMGMRSGGEQVIISDLFLGLSSMLKVRFDFLEDLWIYVTGLFFFLGGLYFSIQINFHFPHHKVFYVLAAVSSLTGLLNTLDNSFPVSPIPVDVEEKIYEGHQKANSLKKMIHFHGGVQLSGSGALKKGDSLISLLNSSPRLHDFSFDYYKTIEKKKYPGLNLISIGSLADLENVKPLLGKENQNFWFVIEAREKGLEKNFLMEMARETDEKGYRVLNLHKYLWNKRNSGFLYWGERELTSWGQELAFKYLEAEISKLNEK